ncbi:hypothetical protein PoB_001647800 [Plakobranchus ocellatus]|uniref:Uncharacterized protein n=1 Tax=Plakobranchus ocellatus TaxID=259542 RepID=A0AAV3Z5J3_9GAST|nr:hypothetical protein PoB_001647800 [Plakobranchus ocellatus]
MEVQTYSKPLKACCEKYEMCSCTAKRLTSLSVLANKKTTPSCREQEICENDTDNKAYQPNKEAPCTFTRGSEKSTKSTHLRRSKRCLTKNHSWRSVMSRSVKEKQDKLNEKLETSKCKQASSCRVDKLVKSNKTRVNTTNRPVRKKHLDRTQTVKSISPKKCKVKHNAKLHIDDIWEDADDEFWSLLFVSLAESSSDEESEQANKMYKLQKENHNLGINWSTQSVDNKSDANIIVHLGEAEATQCTRDSILKDDLNKGTFSSMSVVRNDGFISNDSLMTISETIPSVKETVLDKFEIPNKYIVTVCEVPHNGPRVPDASVVPEKCPAVDSEGFCPNILRSGLETFILCAASDPQRRRKQQY